MFYVLSYCFFYYFRYEINAIDDNDIEESDIESNDYWLQKIETYATKVFEHEVTNISTLNEKSSEKQWLKTVLKSGALNDKISAYSVMLQENPVGNLASLEHLINMISLKSRRPCLMAIDALVELFPNHLVSSTRCAKIILTNLLQVINKVIINILAHCVMF